MATVEINVSGEVASQRMRVDLDGTPYRLHLDWNESAAAWFMSLYTDDGVPVVTGRRLSAGSSPWYSFREGAPRGVFLVYGPLAPAYGQAALGRSIRLLYVEASP